MNNATTTEDPTMTTENRYLRPLNVSGPPCQVCNTHCDHSKRGTAADSIKCIRETIGLVRIGSGRYETPGGRWEVVKRPGKQSWYFRGFGGIRTGEFNTLQTAIFFLYVKELAPEGSHHHSMRRCL